MVLFPFTNCIYTLHSNAFFTGLCQMHANLIWRESLGCLFISITILREHLVSSFFLVLEVGDWLKDMLA
jgi:hypothetical protein